MGHHFMRVGHGAELPERESEEPFRGGFGACLDWEVVGEMIQDSGSGEQVDGGRWEPRKRLRRKVMSTRLGGLGWRVPLTGDSRAPGTALCVDVRTCGGKMQRPCPLVLLSSVSFIFALIFSASFFLLYSVVLCLC